MEKNTGLFIYAESWRVKKGGEWDTVEADWDNQTRRKQNKKKLPK